MTSESGTSNPDFKHRNTNLSSNFISIFVSGTIPTTGYKLIGYNYNQWSHLVMIFISGKRKEDFLTRATLQPQESSPNFCK